MMTLKKESKNYDDGLKFSNLENLDERMENHSLKFAKNCLKNEKVRSKFPVNIKNKKKTRNLKSTRWILSKLKGTKNQLLNHAKIVA